jgi:hypothetical protein
VFGLKRLTEFETEEWVFQQNGCVLKESDVAGEGDELVRVDGLACGQSVAAQNGRCIESADSEWLQNGREQIGAYGWLKGWLHVVAPLGKAATWPLA